MTEPRDELRSPELLSTVRRRVTAALVVLAVAAVVIVASRPDAHDPARPLAGASPAAPRSPSSSTSAGPSPERSDVPAPVPPALAARTGARLVVVQGTKLDVLDVDARRASRVPPDDRLAGHDRLDVLTVGRQLVLLGDDQTGAGNGPFPVYATTDGPGSPLRRIGAAGSLIPSDRAGRVWLSDVTDGFRVGSSTIALTTLDEVDVRGRVYRHARFEGTFGALPFAGGYLRRTVGKDKREGRDVELVDAAGKRRQLFSHVSVLVVSGGTALLANRVACDQQCDLHVLTAGPTVGERVLHLGATPELIEAAIVNGGSRLFVGVRHDGTPPAPSIVSELSLTTGAWRTVTDARGATFYGGSYQFSADGRWMFFVDADDRHVDAYDLAGRKTYRVEHAFAQITQLELLSS